MPTKGNVIWLIILISSFTELNMTFLTFSVLGRFSAYIGFLKLDFNIFLSDFWKFFYFKDIN